MNKNIRLALIIAGLCAAVQIQVLAHEGPQGGSQAFSVAKYFAPDAAFDNDDALFAKAGNTLFLLNREAYSSSLIACDIPTNTEITRIKLPGGAWYTGVYWSEEIRKLLCFDASGAIVLIDPKANWKKEIISLGKETFPRHMDLRGNLLLVTHHNYERLDLFELSEGTIHLKRTFPLMVSSAVFLSERYCIVSRTKVELLDLETGERTILINLPEWETYATTGENLSFDRSSNTLYFTMDGKVLAYTLDGAPQPRYSEEIIHGSKGFSILAGSLFMLDPDYYAYDAYDMGLTAQGGFLSIASTDYSGNEMRHSQTRPYAPGDWRKTRTVTSQDEGWTTFAYIRTLPNTGFLPTDSAFPLELLANQRFIETRYITRFSQESMEEVIQKLASDEVLKQAFAEEVGYGSLPGDERYLLLMNSMPVIPKDLRHIRVMVFPSNPWIDDGSILLCIFYTDDDLAERMRVVRNLIQNRGAYSIDKDVLTKWKGEYVISFPLLRDPKNPEAEPKRIEEHLRTKYPGFISLEKDDTN